MLQRERWWGLGCFSAAVQVVPSVAETCLWAGVAISWVILALSGIFFFSFFFFWLTVLLCSVRKWVAKASVQEEMSQVMQTDKGIRSAALQEECEAVSMFKRDTGVLWKAVLSHEWQQGDKGRLKVKRSIHREDYQEKACVSYYPFHSWQEIMCLGFWKQLVAEAVCALLLVHSACFAVNQGSAD